MPGRTLLALVPFFLTACSAPALDGSVRYVQVGLSGDLVIADSTASLTASNDLDALGLGEEDEVASVAVDFKWGSPHLSISTQSSTHSGAGVLQTDFTSNGTTITAGAAIASNMDIALTSLNLTFDLAPTDTVEFGIGFGVTALGIDGSFTESSTGSTVSTDEVLPIPVAALRAGVQLGSFEVAGLLSGISVSTADLDASFFDLDLFGRWNFLGGQERLSGSLVAGWREADFDLEFDDGTDVVDTTLEISGPYLGFQVSF